MPVVLWLPLEVGINPSPHICLDVKTDDGTHAPRKHEKKFISHISGLPGESRACIQAILKWLEWNKGIVALVFTVVWRAGAEWVFPCISRVCVVWSSLLMPKERAPGLSYQLVKCGARGKEMGWSLSNIKNGIRLFNTLIQNVLQNSDFGLKTQILSLATSFIRCFLRSDSLTLLLTKHLLNTQVWIIIVC